MNVSATVKPLQVGICVISMPETRYAGDLIEHRLKYMTDFLFGLGDLGRTNLFQDRPYRFAQGVLHFRTVGSCSSERRFRANLRPGHPKVKRKTEVVLEAKR